MMSFNLFLIDDDADDRTLFAEAIFEIDSQIVCESTSDCKTALKRFMQPGVKQPDLIFMDINMPATNGWECVRLLRATDSSKSIPVIMYSTSSNDTDIELTTARGAFCLLTKPDDYDQLLHDLAVVINLLKKNELDTIPVKATPWVRAYRL